MRGCTWEEHGGDNLWLLQRVDYAALEGLTDGRLQVAEQRHDEEEEDKRRRFQREVGAAVKFFQEKKKGDRTGFLPHPGETVLPELVHDEARSVGKVLDRDAAE